MFVLFTLDSHHAYVGQGARVDAAATMDQLPFRQQMPLEHDVDRIEVEFLAQIENRQIFVVELAMFSPPSHRHR